MSKSAPDPASRIELLDSADVIRRKLKRAVTDSGREIRHDRATKPAISNLLEMLALASGRQLADLEVAYQDAGYGRLKQDVAEAVITLLTPLQERHRQLLAAPDHLTAVLRAGSEKASALARTTMTMVRERVGLLAPSTSLR